MNVSPTEPNLIRTLVPQEMTMDICESPPGQLTDEMLQRAPDLMHALSHTRAGGKENALAVEQLLVRLLEERRSGNGNVIATTEEYNCLLEGWARSKAGVAGVERCEQILSEMEDRYHLQGDKTIQPNMQSFKTVLMAWKVSDAPFAPMRAQRILEWMIRLATDGENEKVLPDADCFDIVLQIWSRSGRPDATEKTEKLLSTMERLYTATGSESLRPRTSSFNAVLAAWCKSNSNGAVDRATTILKFMEEHAKAGETQMAPDEGSYTTVVSALLKSRGPKSARTAEELLRKAEQITAPEAPDTILYNTVIGCWARSNRSGAYRKARSILDRQVSNYENGSKRSKPDVYGFTSVIASCAMDPGCVKERTKAFHVALAAYQQLLRYEKPNHVTYGTMLKACARLLPDNEHLRHKWAKKIWKQSVREGYVGDMVVSRMREAVSPPIYRDLMQGNSKRNLPEEWVRNVVEKSAYRKKQGKKSSKRGEV